MGVIGSGEPKRIADTVRLLADVARELSRISGILASRAEENSPEAEKLKASQEALANLARQLEEETRDKETADRETTRLRQVILENLHRRGPALFPELAAATLSLPDEIRPVLQEMKQEGLVEIKTLRGWDVVFLTARGRDAIRSA